MADIIPAPGATPPAAPPATAPATTAPAAAPASTAPAPAAPGNLIADGKTEAPPATAPVAPTADEQKAFLTAKGMKPDELAKLDAAALKTKFDEAKAAEGKPAVVKAEDIKITLPEGVTVDEATMGKFKGIIADANLSPNDRAQALVDLHAAALKSAAEAPYNLWNETQTQWRKDVAADPEVGGAAMDANLGQISKVIDQLGGADAAKMKEAFNFTGAGNNLFMVKLMHRVSKILNEGGHVSGGAPADAKGKDFQSTLNTMYPSMAPKTGAGAN